MKMHEKESSHMCYVGKQEITECIKLSQFHGIEIYIGVELPTV